MKKIIALVLCLVMVVALSVSAFADVEYTNAETAAHYLDRLTFFEEFEDDLDYKHDYIWEIASFWDHYFTQTGMILAKYGMDDEDPGYLRELKAYQMEAKAKLADLRMAYKFEGLDLVNQEGIDELYDWAAVVDGGMDRDTVLDTVKEEQDALMELKKAAQELNESEDNAFLFAYYSKLAAKDAEKAAAAKKEAELLAKIAAATKDIDTTTPAGQLLYAGTAAKVRAEDSLASAKKAADNAKKLIAVAQKGALTDAQAAVLNAQAFAYNEIASGINAEVASYVDSVYTAIADFYAGFGK